VHITSPSAAKKPEVRFNYYTHPLDLEVHARHVLALHRLARTKGLRSVIKAEGARFPEKDLTVAEAKEFLRANATTNYHPCGTCAMLPESQGGVVDEKLKVYGTSNVRVVDASVFPIIPRGNIITTVYAVAEKAAEILLEELGAKETRR
jgi:choline dehydrogenase-like flavoprotein